MNTFQAVLATDGFATYAMFLYEEINWYSRPVVIGFNAGDGARFFNLLDSNDFEGRRTLNSTSNVGIPGTYIFRVDQNQTLSNG